MKPLKLKIYMLSLFLSFSMILKAQEHQIVNQNDFIINDKLSLFTTKNDLTKVIKKFDEIESVEMEMECGFEEEIKKGIKFYMYKRQGLSYFVHGENAHFDSMDFANYSNNFIVYTNKKISNRTTGAELKSLFPIAYRNYLNEMKDDKHKGTMILKFNKDWDDELRLYIENGKVCAFGYWYPC